MRVVASIRKVIHESGRTSWQARWRDPAGEQRSKNFDRRVDAGRHLTTVEARKLAGTYVDPRAGRLKLGEFAERTTLGWLNRRDSTKARDDSYLNSLVLPSFANTSLGAVHPTDIQEWVARLDADGYSPATIRKAYQLLGRIFSDAVQAGLIVRSPCLTITLPRVESSEMRFLSPDEIGTSRTPSTPASGPWSSLWHTPAAGSARSAPLISITTSPAVASYRSTGP